MAREKKFTTEELYDIIHKFHQVNKNLGIKLNFSNLARYAEKELYINGIRYYHFSRNKDVSQRIKEYNKSLKEGIIEYVADNSYFATLDVREFIKSHTSNPERLLSYLNNLQLIHKKLYDRTIDAEFKVKEFKQKISELSGEKDDYKTKYRAVKSKNTTLQQEMLIYKEALDLKVEGQLIDALNSTELYTINNGENLGGSNEVIKDLDDTNGKNIEKLIAQFEDVFD